MRYLHRPHSVAILLLASSALTACSPTAAGDSAAETARTSAAANPSAAGGYSIDLPSHWVAVGRSPDFQLAVDTVIARADRGGVRTRLRLDFAAPQTSEGSDQPAFRRTELEEILDCEGRRAIDLGFVHFDAHGEPVAGYEWPSPSWRPMEGHQLQRYLEFACDGLRLAGKDRLAAGT